MIIGEEDEYSPEMRNREDGKLRYDAHWKAHPDHASHHRYQGVTWG